MQTGLTPSLPLSLSLPHTHCEVAAIFIFQHIQRPKMSIFCKKMALFCVTLARITTTTTTTSWVRMRQRGWLRHVAGEICEQMVENDTAGPTLLLHDNWATVRVMAKGKWEMGNGVVGSKCGSQKTSISIKLKVDGALSRTGERGKGQRESGSLCCNGFPGSNL